MNARFFFVLALAVSASLAGCATETDDSLSAGGVTGTVRIIKQPFSENKNFVTRFSSNGLFDLRERFFLNELNLPDQPPTLPWLMAFPHKDMLIGEFDGAEGDMIFGFTRQHGEPHIVVLAGCIIDQQGKMHSRSGISDNNAKRCDFPHQYDGETFYENMQISEHGSYWIDYQTEDIYEIRLNGFNTIDNDIIGVAGLDEARQHLLMLYKTKDKNQFNVCAYTAVAGTARSFYQCFTFVANELPERTAGTQRIVPPVPMLRGSTFRKGSDAEVAKRFAWLSRYFELTSASDNKPLIAKPGTKIIASQADFQ